MFAKLPPGHQMVLKVQAIRWRDNRTQLSQEIPSGLRDQLSLAAGCTKPGAEVKG
jgi:hypothetical protein